MKDEPRATIENQTDFATSDVEILSRRDVYRGFFSMEEIHLRHRRFDGGWTKTIRRERFVRGHAVAVLLYDPASDRAGLIEQFRIGALEEPSPWLLEVVAGVIGSGETPQEVARREVREEAGIEIAELEFICDFLVSPGGTNEKVYLYCGLADLSLAGGVFGLPQENEDIRFFTLPREEALAHLAAGRCNNSAAVICLQWLQINSPRLRAEKLSRLQTGQHFEQKLTL